MDGDFPGWEPPGRSGDLPPERGYSGCVLRANMNGSRTVRGPMQTVAAAAPSLGRICCSTERIIVDGASAPNRLRSEIADHPIVEQPSVARHLVATGRNSAATDRSSSAPDEADFYAAVTVLGCSRSGRFRSPCLRRPDFGSCYASP